MCSSERCTAIEAARSATRKGPTGRVGPRVRNADADARPIATQVNHPFLRSQADLGNRFSDGAANQLAGLSLVGGRTRSVRC